MPREFVDLHAHSTASDGTFSPEQLARHAQACGLVGFALTDHDTAAGVQAAGDEAKRLGLQFLPGVEISAQCPRPGTLHLLGYGIDPDSAAMKELSAWQVEARDRRNVKIVQRLKDLGLDVTLEEVQERAQGVVGRPHIAMVLIAKGYVASKEEAFAKYLTHGGAAYVDRERLPPRQAIDLVRRAGGLTVLAHPVQLRTGNDAELRRLVKDLVDLGLAGIEVIHSDHNDALIAKYTKLADRLGLLKTGGSDFHGENKRIPLGVARGHRIPRSFMDELMARLKAT